mmetsp:Transcript_43612/g.110025  ORF Transcript_43612/g.110025 Transcript_43612/m.110025 type:complete len:403 (-) Transcript_43612:105-1313(-)
MAQRQSSGNFQGVFTLRTQAEAQELSDRVKGIVEKAVDIFEVIKVDPRASDDLCADLRAISDLVGRYPSICREETRHEAESLVAAVQRGAKEVITVLDDHLNELGRTATVGRPLNRVQQEGVANGMKTTLEALVGLVDHMEKAQMDRLRAVLQSAFQSVLLLRETRSDYRFSTKVRHAVEAFKNAVELWRKRAALTDELVVRQGVEKACVALEEGLRPLVEATRAVIASQGAAGEVAAQDRCVEQLAVAFKVLGALVERTGTGAARAGFSHDINEEMERLRQAVRTGSTAAAVKSAKLIAAEVAALRGQDSDSLEAQAALNASCDALTGLTARLVAATKEALDDPGNDANLERAIADMQCEVGKVELLHNPAGEQASTNDLKQSLLACSKQLAGAMTDMADE